MKSAPEEIAVETRRLGGRYGKQWALRECTLRLPAGRVIALVGPNGAGKSTLMHMLVGLLAPVTGDVAVFGRRPGTSVEALADVAFLAQDHPLYRSFRVEELVHFGRSLNPRFDVAFARERLECLEIPLDRAAGKLSGGQQTQVALTLALAKRPRLLVLDEPASSLDPLARHDLMAAVLANVADTGMTVIFSSHIVVELEQACDYLVLLANGRVQVEGDIAELLDGHRRLVGATNDALPGRVAGVVTSTHAARQVDIIARVDAAAEGAGWAESQLSLGDLVLAYLRSPRATITPAPAVVHGPDPETETEVVC